MATLKRCLLKNITVPPESAIYSLPSPMGGLPAIGLVVSDNVSDRREWKMVAHRHNAVGRGPVQDSLARLDRLGGVVVKDRRPLGTLQACHRIMGDIAHEHELLRARGKQN